MEWVEWLLGLALGFDHALGVPLWVSVWIGDSAVIASLLIQQSQRYWARRR